MFLTDTHCHLNKEYYPNGLDTIFLNALAANVKRVLFVSSDIPTSEEAVQTANLPALPLEVWAGAGVHPHDASTMPDGIAPELRRLAADSKVKAVAEIGLDYFYDMSPRKLQQKVFAEQIEFAKQIKKPIVVHIRNSKIKSEGDAMADNLSIMAETNASACGGVVHCFSGNWDEAVKLLDMGFYLSFTGVITFKSSVEMREIAAKMPQDRIMCETDSPYLAPVPYRGKTNEPAHVARIYELIALLRGLSVDEFARIVEDNSSRLFGWESRNV